MESKDELKEIDHKNCTCYHFGDTTGDLDIDSNYILLDEKSSKNEYENILIHDVLYKTFTSAKRLHIRFNNAMQFMIGLNLF